MTSDTPCIWVPNRGPFNYGPLDAHGTPIFLTEGDVPRQGLDRWIRSFAPQMIQARPDDYMVIGGLPVLSCAVILILAARFPRSIRVLSYTGGKYLVEPPIDLGSPILVGAHTLTT